MHKQVLQGQIAKENYKNLSSKERVKALALAHTLDADEKEAVNGYATETQARVLQFYQRISNQNQEHDTWTKINDVLILLQLVLQKIDANELIPGKTPFFTKILKKDQTIQENIIQTYQEISIDIAEISQKLQFYQKQLIDDNELLDSIYHKNDQFQREFSMYQAGIAMKMRDIEKRELPNAFKDADISEDDAKIKELQHFQQLLNNRLANLDDTNQIVSQQADYIKAFYESNQLLINEININVYTILISFENQFVLTLTLFKQKNSRRGHKRQAILDEEIDAIMQLQKMQQHLSEVVATAISTQRSENNTQLQTEKQMYSLIGQLEQLLIEAGVGDK